MWIPKDWHAVFILKQAPLMTVPSAMWISIILKQAPWRPSVTVSLPIIDTSSIVPYSLVCHCSWQLGAPCRLPTRCHSGLVEACPAVASSQPQGAPALLASQAACSLPRQDLQHHSSAQREPYLDGSTGSTFSPLGNLPGVWPTFWEEDIHIHNIADLQNFFARNVYVQHDWWDCRLRWPVASVLTKPEFTTGVDVDYLYLLKWVVGFSRSYHCTVDVVLCYILCDWCRSVSSQWPCWSWFVPDSGWCWRSGGVWLAQLWSWLVAQTRQPTWPGWNKHSDSIWLGFCFSLLLLCSVSVRMLAQRWTGKLTHWSRGDVVVMVKV